MRNKININKRGNRHKNGIKFVTFGNKNLRTMPKIALFPGSFDPITVGHESVVRRALPLFDKIVVAVGRNTAKNSVFDVESRVEMIEQVFANEKRVTVMSFDGLTVDLCKSLNINYILRGLRTSADFEYERAVGQVNKALYRNIETVFMLTLPEHTPISSSIVRDILLHGGNVNEFIPAAIDINNFIKK